MTREETLITAALAWADDCIASGHAVSRTDIAVLDAARAYHAAPPDPWAALFAEVRQGLSEPLTHHALSDIGATGERADDAMYAVHRDDYAHTREALLAAVRHAMRALRALDLEAGK